MHTTVIMLCAHGFLTYELLQVYELRTIKHKKIHINRGNNLLYYSFRRHCQNQISTFKTVEFIIQNHYIALPAVQSCVKMLTEACCFRFW